MLSDNVVRLRPFQNDSGDIDRAVTWYQDPEVLYFSEGPGTLPFDRQRVERMYQFLAAHGELYWIDVWDNGQWWVVGDVTLSSDTMPIVIGERRWRSQGIGSRVLALLIERARALGWPCLIAKHIYADNIKSQRLFARHGFRVVHSGVDSRGQQYYRYQLDLKSE